MRRKKGVLEKSARQWIRIEMILAGALIKKTVYPGPSPPPISSSCPFAITTIITSIVTVWYFNCCSCGTIRYLMRWWAPNHRFLTILWIQFTSSRTEWEIMLSPCSLFSRSWGQKEATKTYYKKVKLNMNRSWVKFLEVEIFWVGVT
jgi:hypothetical protein